MCSTRHTAASGTEGCAHLPHSNHHSVPRTCLAPGEGGRVWETQLLGQGFIPNPYPSDCCFLKNGQTDLGPSPMKATRPATDKKGRDPLRWSAFFFENVSQLCRAARHWGQRLEIVRGRGGVPEDIMEAQRSKGRTAKLKELEAPTLGSEAGDFIRTGNLLFSDGVPTCLPQGHRGT